MGVMNWYTAIFYEWYKKQDSGSGFVVLDKVVKVSFILIFDEQLKRDEGIYYGKECFRWI